MDYRLKILLLTTPEKYNFNITENVSITPITV